MIPNNRFSATVDNHLGGERVAMQIAPKATVHLMSLLTDLYSNPVLACIREYSTNAFDSHLDAGQARPIEVRTPNGYSPYFTVKDYGVGMDADTIRTLYSQYGESTKREQKTTNGSMGIGAKAALGYTTQFTVTGIKNGVKTLVSVSRDEDGSGVMEIVSVSATTEDNGVEIKIPCKFSDEYRFGDEANSFFSYWKAGTVLLNGQEPHKNFEALTPRLQFIDGSYDYVVMGNVPYRLDAENSITENDGRAVVAFVTMNGDDEVVFTPSREGLIYNAITKASLVGLREEYREYIAIHLKEKLEKAENFIEAVNNYANVVAKYSWARPEEYTWKGMKPHHFVIKHPTKVDEEGNPKSVGFMQFHHTSKKNQIEYFDGMSSKIILRDTVIVITGFPTVRSVNYKFKERIRQYLTDNNIFIGGYMPTQIYITHETELLPAIAFKEKTFYKWSDILASTRDPAPRTIVKTAGRYDAYDASQSMFVLRDIRVDEDIIYWSPANGWTRPASYNMSDIQKCFPTKTFIRAFANRHPKLQKDFTSTASWKSIAHEYTLMKAKDAFDKVPAGYFERAAYHAMFFEYGPKHGHLGTNYESSLLKMVDSIEDEEYARVIRLACHQKQDFGIASSDPRWEASQVELNPRDFENYKVKYPLSDGNWTSQPEACVEYVNMKYAKMKENSNGN